jgi:PEP-CTERM motif
MAHAPLAIAAGGRQLSLAAIDLLPNAPTTYQLRDWTDVAQKFDNLVFDVNATGQFLPLTRIDTTPQYPLLQESFGIAAYVGETRTYGENGELVFESLSTLGAVLGGSLVGIDKSSGPHNWVSMTREFSGDKRGLPLILNGPFDGTGGSAWYETIPSILFYSIADRYPNQTELAPVLDVVDDAFYGAVNVLTAGGTAPNFYHTAFNFATQQPVDNGIWREPDMGLGMAWLQHAAYWRNRDSNPAQAANYLNAVNWSLAYYEQISANPDYEILTPFGVYTAARMNAEHGGNYDIQKFVKWVFERSNARDTKIMISGEQWGGQDVGGLMGFTIPNTGSNVRGYAFSMNTFVTAMPMVPLARYEDRYSRAIGKWMLNAANAARLFYADAHSAQNQSSEFWTGDPDSSIAYEGLRHHWYSPFDGQQLYAGGDALPSPWTSGYGPLTDFAMYGGAYAGVFGSIIKTTNVEKILQLDLLATDFYHDAAHSTYLYYNPLGTTKAVAINLASGTYDLYDAVSNRYLARGATSQAYFNVPADEAVMLVLVPSGGTETRDGRRLLVDGVVIDYNATLLPDNLVRNPDVDAAQTNNSNRPTFWHYSSHATWSDEVALSPNHSLELVDASTTDYEEWRSYATDVPAGQDRSFKLRWFWKYDVAAGEEFRARLRLSNDDVTSLDLTNPATELNFTVSGTATDFEMFETTIDLPDGVRSFDLTFISGGALSALGTIYIDDISAAIVRVPVLLGDYNSNGIVDAADYVVWRNSLGATGVGLAADGDGDQMVTQLDYDIWKTNFGTTAEAATSLVENSSVPEPSTVFLFALGVSMAATLVRRGTLGGCVRS